MKTAEEWTAQLSDDPYCVPCGLAMIRAIQADALDAAGLVADGHREDGGDQESSTQYGAGWDDATAVVAHDVRTLKPEGT